MSDYDSRPETHEHIAVVRGLLLGVVEDLLRRAHRHDRTKLADPERDAFDRWTPKLDEAPYGTEAYTAALAGLSETGALQHHYAANDHHPEHFSGGIAAMDLIQVLEMLCDWIAAGRRPGGTNDPHGSIDLNAKRYGYGEELADLLHRTVDRLQIGEVGT